MLHHIKFSRYCYYYCYRRSQESLASPELLPETAVRARGPRGESLPEDAQSLRHGESDSVPDTRR